jgi:hypothetical protein
MLIAVWGTAPGIGKSTLSAGLARWLTEAGWRVDHFAEEDIFARPEFTDVARLFRATGEVEPEMLLVAASRFGRAVLASDVDVVVADAFVPFVPSLLAIGCSDHQVRRFVAELTTALAPLDLALAFLEGDPAAALARAAAREDPGWLQWYTGKLARYGLAPHPGDLTSALTYLARERAVTLDAVRQAGWRVVTIERATELSAAEILQSARGLLGEGTAWPCRPAGGGQRPVASCHTAADSRGPATPQP